MEWSMRLVSHEQGIISRCDAAMMMLAREIDELASDVVVYGMVSRSVASLGQPTAECLGVCRSSIRLGTWRGRRGLIPTFKNPYRYEIHDKMRVRVACGPPSPRTRSGGRT